MKVLETKGITMPEAPIVCKAVAYAREMAPLRRDFDSQKAKAEQAHAQHKSHQRHWERHQYDHVTHEDAVEALIGEWLTVRGSDDLSTILTYVDQMDELREAFLESTMDVCHFHDGDGCFVWLVLQGQSVFEAVLATPEMAVLLIDHHSNASGVLGPSFLAGLRDCLLRLLASNWDIETFLEYYGWEYKESGALPDDFKGRLLNEVLEEWWQAHETAD